MASFLSIFFFEHNFEDVIPLPLCAFFLLFSLPSIAALNVHATFSPFPDVFFFSIYACDERVVNVTPRTSPQHRSHLQALLLLSFKPVP